MSRGKSSARGAKARHRGSENTAEEFFFQAAQEVQTPIKKAPEQLKPRTDSQHRYMNAIKSSPLIFAAGPAGTGKTYICGAMAAEALDSKQIDKIIITRPVVEAGESLGFLPGELEEKFEPFLAPFRDVLNERLGKTYVDYLIKASKIEAAPLAYMRGRTFKNAWVILDEAQNTTPAQMRMFLTRMGEDCKMIVNGDIQQKDIAGMCGLEDAINRLSYISSLKIVQFTRRDVVRCGLVQEMVEAYEQGLGADTPIRR